MSMRMISGVRGARPLAGALALLAAVAVTGCSGRQPPEDEQANSVEAEPAPEPVRQTLPPPPVPTPVVEEPAPKETVELPPEESIAPDEQILDDADATGMTARLPPVSESEPANRTEDEDAGE